MEKDDIIVVTGLPRSGTSLMMQILQSMGIEIFTDNKRPLDESNPKGYFEHELVKTIENDSSWLKNAKGKAVKIVSPLLIYLPENFNYKIIFMQRDLDEIINSQNKMIASASSKKITTDKKIFEKIFNKNLILAMTWILRNPNVECLDMSFSKLVYNPNTEIKKIKRFLNIDVDLKNVIKVIDKNLYRSRFL